MSEKELIPFVKFQKIPRWSRNVIVTEKIDGTNGVVHISDNGQVIAGSRTRWITPEQDNHGFAKWVKEHEVQLRELGIGYHHGEWWGSGINRGYGLKEKRWSLLNSTKWRESRPACCHVVPILYEGMMNEQAILKCLTDLAQNGSTASPQFKPAEGIVIYHVQGNLFFKKTILHDEVPKTLVGKEE